MIIVTCSSAALLSLWFLLLSSARCLQNPPVPHSFQVSIQHIGPVFCCSMQQNKIKVTCIYICRWSLYSYQQYVECQSRKILCRADHRKASTQLKAHFEPINPRQGLFLRVVTNRSSDTMAAMYRWNLSPTKNIANYAGPQKVFIRVTDDLDC